MSIYAISDLHLSFNTNKPMDIFGWENYEERIKKNWLEKVNEKDLVLLPGDFSWEMKLENTYKDCPFPDDFESVTMKQCKNKKWFALIMNVNNKLYLNVKTDPNYSDILRNTYDYIIPAYHMNKEHWNTIIVDEKVDENLVKELIEQSYQLTK